MHALLKFYFILNDLIEQYGGLEDLGCAYMIVIQLSFRYEMKSYTVRVYINRVLWRSELNFILQCESLKLTGM